MSGQVLIIPGARAVLYTFCSLSCVVFRSVVSLNVCLLYSIILHAIYLQCVTVCFSRGMCVLRMSLSEVSGTFEVFVCFFIKHSTERLSLTE